MVVVVVGGVYKKKKALGHSLGECVLIEYVLAVAVPHMAAVSVSWVVREWGGPAFLLLFFFLHLFVGSVKVVPPRASWAGAEETKRGAVILRARGAKEAFLGQGNGPFRRKNDMLPCVSGMQLSASRCITQKDRVDPYGIINQGLQYFVYNPENE